RDYHVTGVQTCALPIYLDLGYVMFGEDYKRGAFLLNMQEEQIKINNDCGTDLSDNICNVLTLMTKSEDDVFVEDLVWRIFIPCEIGRASCRDRVYVDIL